MSEDDFTSNREWGAMVLVSERIALYFFEGAERQTINYFNEVSLRTNS